MLNLSVCVCLKVYVGGRYVMGNSKVKSSRSVVSNFATPWTVACQAPLSMEFSRQEYWSRLPLLTPGDLCQPKDRTCVSYLH